MHPLLKRPLSGPHAKSDPVTGDVYKYNLDLGRTGSYRIFTVSATTGKASILATINHAAAYLHSIFLTEHYVILCVWNSFFKAGGISILWTKNYDDAMSNYYKSKPSTWFIVDRKASRGRRKRPRRNLRVRRLLRLPRLPHHQRIRGTLSHRPISRRYYS